MSCEWVYGWAWDGKDPGKRLIVEVTDGDIPLGTSPADGPRPDLVAAGMGDGRYGFRYVFPASIKDGKPHSIRIRVAGTTYQLRNTPKPLTCPAP